MKFEKENWNTSYKGDSTIRNRLSTENIRSKSSPIILQKQNQEKNNFKQTKILIKNNRKKQMVL